MFCLCLLGQFFFTLNDIFTLNFFSFLVRMPKTYNLSRFQVYNSVLLTIVTVLDITSPDLIYLITESLYFLTNFIQFPSHLPLESTSLLCLYVCLFVCFFQDSMYKRDNTVFVFLYLVCFT